LAGSGSTSTENRRKWLERELDELKVPIPGRRWTNRAGELLPYYAALTDNMVSAIINSNIVRRELRARQDGSMATGFPRLQPIEDNARQQLQVLVDGITEVRQCLENYRNAKNNPGLEVNNCGDPITGVYPNGLGGSGSSIPIGNLIWLANRGVTSTMVFNWISGNYNPPNKKEVNPSFTAAVGQYPGATMDEFNLHVHFYLHGMRRN